jgi:hypothetical protein
MSLPVPHAFYWKRLKAFLLCFILGCIRTLASAGRVVLLKACSRALEWWYRALKPSFDQYRTHHDLLTRDSKAEGPYDLLCSSLPLEFPMPVHGVAPGSTSACQEEPVAPFIQDALAEVNVNRPTTNTAPPSQPHVASELTFEVSPLVRATHRRYYFSTPFRNHILSLHSSLFPQDVLYLESTNVLHQSSNLAN